MDYVWREAIQKQLMDRERPQGDDFAMFGATAVTDMQESYFGNDVVDGTPPGSARGSNEGDQPLPGGTASASAAAEPAMMGEVRVPRGGETQDPKGKIIEELTTKPNVLRQKLAPRQCCEYCITAYAAESNMYSSTTVASYVPSRATRRRRSAPRVWSK